MKEQFDKELRNHIKDTFGAFDDHLADDGWRKLNDRKKRKRRAFIFWYVLPSGIAASIAFLLLLNQGVEIPSENIKPDEKTIVKQNPLNDFENKASSPTISDKKTAPALEKNVSKIAQEESLIVKESKLSLKKEQTELVSDLSLNKSNQTLASLPIGEKTSKIIDEDIVAKEKTLVAKKIELSTTSPETELIVFNDFIERVQGVSAQERGFISPNSDLNQTISPKLAENPFISSDKLAVLNANKTNSKDKKSLQNGKKFKIGIDANTYVNFSENGINDKINLGLGIVSEIKLTKQISINTGIALNGQNSTFNGNQKSNQDFLSSAASFSNIAAVPSAQVTNAKLVGLDIPLNLKYAIKMGKTNGFISSGFSSYSVINEKYFNEYSVINYSFNGVSTSRVSNVTDNPSGKFSYFKFARTIDVSFGILYPFSKKSTLSIEPFMKYPLSGLGYQDLKIGSSGISFKINFGQ